MHKQGQESSIPPPRPKRKSTHPYPSRKTVGKTETSLDETLMSNGVESTTQSPGIMPDIQQNIPISTPEALAASYLTNPAQLNQWIANGLVGGKNLKFLFISSQLVDW